jgi:hypothetical protein
MATPQDKIMLKSAAVALAFIASISTASAQMLCMSLDDVKKMTKGSGEEPQVAGSLEEAGISCSLHHQRGETWTAVMVRPNGLACVLGVGKKLEVIWPTEPDGKDI